MEIEFSLLYRAYRVLAECNEALIRASSEPQLLEEICRILVETGGYRMAWVGYAEEDDARRVRPVARWGFKEGYLESIRVTCWDETELGRGPAGTAVRTGRPAFVKEIQANPRFDPWREAALDRGYASSIALPLRVEDKTLGVLNIYAGQPDAFHKDEVDLLMNLAANLAHGIEAFRGRQARLRAEMALRESEEKYRNLFHRLPVGLYRIAPEGRFLEANPALVQLLGYTDRESLLNTYVTDIYERPEDRGRWMQLMEDEGVVQDLEMLIRCSDGRIKWVVDSGHAVRDAEGKVLYYEGLLKDITAQKSAEEEVRWQQAVLEGINRVFRETLTCETDADVARTCLAVAEELTGSRFGFVGKVKRDGRFDTFALSDPGWEACRMAESKALRLLKDMEIRGFWGRAIKEGESQIVNDPGSDPDRLGLPEGHPPITRFLGVPLKQAGRTVGMIALANKEADFDQNDKQSVEALSMAFMEALMRKQMEEALRQSEENYRHLIEFSPEGIIVVRQGKVTFINQSGLKLFGATSPEQILGKTPFDLVHPDCHPGLRETLSRSEEMQEGAVIRLEEKIVKLDGTVLDVETMATSFIDGEGPAFQVFLRDITRRKQAGEMLRARTQELEVLFNLSSHMRVASSAKEILPIVLRETISAVKADAGLVAMLDRGGENLTISAAKGFLEPDTGLTFGLEEGITGQVLRTGRPYMIEDYGADPHRLEALGHARETGPAVFVPLRSEEGLVGVLMVARRRSPQARPFSSFEGRLCAAMGEMAGNAIRRVQLFHDALRRLRQVEALRNVDLAITSSLDPRLTLRVLLDEVTKQLDVDAADVLLLDPHSQVLECTAWRGFRTKGIQRTRLRLGEGYAGRVALERSPLGITDPAGAEDTLRDLFQNEGFVAYYAAPMISKGHVLGVLETFHRRPLETDGEWVEFLESLAGQAAIAIENAQLFHELDRSNMELRLAYDATIEGWSRAMDMRDKETEGHTRRVTEMTVRLALALGVGEEEIVHLRRGAMLHDMGKLGVPDEILLKPSKLTQEEWEIMRRHPQLAYDMLSHIPYLRPALDIPYCHHEKWDGTGYPRGLKGEQIPLSARIFAVVDVWDALSSDRSYRPAWTPERVLAYLREQSGKHFDPRVVEAFLALLHNDAE